MPNTSPKTNTYLSTGASRYPSLGTAAHHENGTLQNIIAPSTHSPNFEPAKTYNLNAPGFEEAFSQECLNEPSVFAYADKLLSLLDDALEKILDLPKVSQFKDPNQIPADILKKRYEFYFITSEKSDFTKNAKKIFSWIHCHEAPYNLGVHQKISLIYRVMESFPQLIQKKAGVQVFNNREEYLIALNNSEQFNDRENKIIIYLKSKNLDGLLDTKALAYFSEWGLQSKSTQDFHYIEPSERLSRFTNLTCFEPREEENFNAKFVFLESFNHECEEKLRGMHYFVLNPKKSWYLLNKRNANFITMTGPSGTADVFFRLNNIFKFSIDEKIACIKGLIANMHLDRHHSIYEVLCVLDADPELLKHLGYDSIDSVLKNPEAALEKIAPVLFAKAKENQPKFMETEIKLRNQLANDMWASLANLDDRYYP